MRKERLETFDSGLNVFRVHFRDDPIVPGLLLLMSELQQRPELARHAAITVKGLAFKSFVRPGQEVAYATDGPDTVVTANGARCCSFSVQGSDAPIDRPDADAPCLYSRAISPTREPEYWFLPERVDMNEDGSIARCRVDVQDVVRQQPYLAQIPAPALLVLTEAAGNLALALQKLRSVEAPAASYVFAKFDLLAAKLHAGPAPARIQVETRVKHFGSILAWDACAFDDHGVRVLVRNAVSVKRKID